MLDKMVNYCRKKSPWLLHVSCGSCNNCDIEILAALAPRFDVERFGGVLKPNPRHADIIVVTGIITLKMRDVLKRLYEQTMDPKAAVAIGSCAITKGIFNETYASYGPADKVIPIAAYIPGCPPRPQAILHGVVTALDALWGG
ncbi:MAG: NADH-quinone oxidoreductase subunit B family protein [Candidatus Methanofastidiosia archaeon]